MKNSFAARFARNRLSIFTYVLVSLAAIAGGGCGGGSAAPGNSNPVAHRYLLSEINFPDSTLAECVTDTGLTYADEVTSLQCRGFDYPGADLSIADATGVEYLTDLTRLHLATNQLTSIDLSANTALTDLVLWGNRLTSIDVSANTALIRLTLNDNQLASIDVSANAALTFLELFNNQLTSIDVSANTALTQLYLERNHLTSIDVSANTALIALSVGDNDLTSIDLSANTALTWLIASDNQLTALDVSANTALTMLWATDNQLASIDLSANESLTQLRLNGNPAVCADTEAIRLQVPTLESDVCAENQSHYQELYDDSFSSWVDSSTVSYIYNYEETGLSRRDGIWEIQVIQSEVVQVSHQGSDPPELYLTVDSAPTIAKLYSRIAVCLDAPVCEISELVIDSDNSIPVSFYASWGEERHGFRIAAFQIQ